MPKKRLVIIIGTLTILLLIVTGVFNYNEKNSYISEINNNVSEMCNKIVVNIEGAEYKLKVNQPLPVNSEIKKRYITSTNNDKKIIAFDVSTIEVKSNLQIKHIDPLIVELSNNHGEWFIDDQNLHNLILEKIILQDYQQAYVKTANTSDGLKSYSIKVLSSESNLNSIRISNNENTWGINYKLVNEKANDVYEFKKEITK